MSRKNRISFKRNQMKGIKSTTGMLMAESVGYGFTGRVAGDVDTMVGNHIATGAFSTGASMAGMPSLVYGAGNVLGSLKMLDSRKKRRRK